MKNILITGGLGYIGGRLAAYLKEIEPATNILLTTRNKNKSRPNWTSPFTVLQMDLEDEKSIDKALDNVDIIIHLAALNEIDSLQDPVQALAVNTQGTYQLLRRANLKKIDRFIYFSTFHVYGAITDSVITEQTPTRPFHPYAITHRAAEDFVTYFSHYYDMKTLVFRLSNGYGYPMDEKVNRWTLVFNDLCKQAVTTGRIVLKSSGRQYRDFISLRDVARAVHRFVFVIPDQWGDGLYNLGGNCNLSVLEVAQKIADLYHAKYKKSIEIETKSQEDDSGKSLRFTYNMDKILKTDFSLKGNMETEILKTLELCEKFIA